MVLVRASCRCRTLVTAGRRQMPEWGGEFKSPPSDTSVSTPLFGWMGRSMGSAKPFSQRFCLAVDGGLDCGARFGKASRPECADLVDKVRLGDDSEIVEARNAVGRHAIVGPEP